MRVNLLSYQFPELLATDADTASNGVITYTLTGADAHYFTLDPQTAQLATEVVLDAEVLHTYHDLQVVATDNGGLSSTVPLQVIVEDVNDFTPLFTIEANTTVTVSEALAPEEVVFVVTASDSDARENILSFSLGPYQQNRVDGELTSGNPFVIDSATGAISVGGQGLDFELSSYYILTVTVEDSGSPPQSNSTQLVVFLTDVNDNSPTFNPHSQSFNILENSPTGKIRDHLISVLYFRSNQFLPMYTSQSVGYECSSLHELSMERTLLPYYCS